MELHPIQSFKAMPTQKKAAVVGGTLAATAAIATGAAYLAGRKTVSPEAKGLQKVGDAIKNGFVGAKDKVVEFFKGLKKEKVQPDAKATEEAAQTVASEGEKALDAAAAGVDAQA